MNRRTILASLAAGVALPGCLGQPAPPPATPRWLSLSPSVTETAFALGASLVGRSTYCLLPPEAEALPTAGTALTPDYEAVASLGPSGILVEGAASVPLDRLKALAPVEVLPWLTLDEVVRSVRRMGERLDVASAATTLASRFETTLTGEAPDDAPRVLLALAGADLGRGVLWYLQPRSLHGAALTAAGFRNAVPGPVEGPPHMSLERLIEIDPDVIVVLAAKSLDDAAKTRVANAFSAIEPLAAARSGRIAVLDGPETLSTGPSILGLPARLTAAVSG